MASAFPVSSARPSYRIATLAALLVAYGSFYLCRANLDAAGPLLIAGEGFDKTTFGELSTIATFTYAIGKFVMGATGDVLGGRKLLAVAIVGSVIFTLLFGTSRTFLWFAVFAAANRFFQSGGWSALVHVVSRRFEAARHGTVMGILSTSYELGNVVALNLSGLVARWGWRALFLVNPLLLAVVGGGAVLALGSGEDKLENVRAREPKVALSFILSRLSRSPAFWFAVAMSALLTFIRVAFLTWTPTYLYEVSKAAGHEEITGAIVKSSLFPASGVGAALAAGWISDRLGRGRRAPVMAVSLSVVVGLVFLLGHAGVTGTTANAMLIGATGFFLLGPYSLQAGAVALDVAGTQGTATATGIIDGAGYLAGTAAGYLLGVVADRDGWAAVFDLICGAAVIATVVAGVWSVVARGRRH